MKIVIVTNIDNGKGLEKDYRLLRDLLSSWGHEVAGVHFKRGRPEPADLAIFLEVYEPRLAEGARRRWLIPNAEWWHPEDNGALGDFELVLCKTRDALSCFAPLSPRARYLGFLSEDRRDPAVPRARRFLHVPGGSIAKGTESVLAAWERHRIPYPLTIVSSLPWTRRPRHTELVGRIDEGRLRRLQNGSWFHLCPSRYEGWGHVIHEGLGVGAAVVVPETPAMSEVDGCALRTPARPLGEQGLARTWSVATDEIRNAVERCMAFTEADLRRIEEAAREAFLEERARLIGNLAEALGEGPPRGAAAEGPEQALVRAVRAAAAPRLRGLYGGVVVAGEAAEQIAAALSRACGLATEIVSFAGLSELPENHACGAVLVLGAGAEGGGDSLAAARRVVKAAGPILMFEMGHARGEPTIRVEYNGCG